MQFIVQQWNHGTRSWSCRLERQVTHFSDTPLVAAVDGKRESHYSANTVPPAFKLSNAKRTNASQTILKRKRENSNAKQTRCNCVANSFLQTRFKRSNNKNVSNTSPNAFQTLSQMHFKHIQRRQ